MIYLHERCRVVKDYLDDNPDRLKGLDEYTQEFAKSHIEICELCRRENSMIQIELRVRDRLTKCTDCFDMRDIEELEDEMISVIEKLEDIERRARAIGINNMSPIFQLGDCTELKKQLDWLQYIRDVIRDKKRGYFKGMLV